VEHEKCGTKSFGKVATNEMISFVSKFGSNGLKFDKRLIPSTSSWIAKD